MAKFKVKKGKYSFSGPKWNVIGFNDDDFIVDAIFAEDCKYKLTENFDQINKLTGKSFSLLPFYDKKSKSWKPGHHKNSARFGWRCVDDENIEILAYVYIDGVRKSKTITSVKTSEWVHLKFKKTDSYYNFKIVKENGESFIAKFKKNDTKKGFLKLFTYRLYPFFGGKIPAPHSMRIELKY